MNDNMTAQEKIKNGEYCYTLWKSSEKEGKAYSLTASCSSGEIGELRFFTENATLARTYMTLLATNEVSPLHIRDLWNDLCLA